MFFDRPFLCSIRMQSESPSLLIEPGFTHAGARRSGQGWPSYQPCSMLRPRHTLTASSTPARLVRSGRRSEGSPLSGAVQSRHNLVSGRSMDPNHDAVMRIGSEAPKRRTHSISRHESQGADRDSATSNRHRSPVTSIWTRPKLSGCRQYLPFIVPDAKRRRRVQRPAAPAATGRSEVYAPRPQSRACEYRERSRCELDTTALRRCLFGT